MHLILEAGRGAGAFNSISRAGCWCAVGTCRDRISACASVLMEGMLVPSKVLLRVLIRSRSFCTARGEKSQCLLVASVHYVSQSKVRKVRRDASKRPGDVEKCD